MTEGGVGGKDTDGAGSDDGTDGEGGDPPQAAVVNATISSIPIPVSFKFAARFLNQHNYVKLRGEACIRHWQFCDFRLTACDLL